MPAQPDRTTSFDRVPARDTASVPDWDAASMPPRDAGSTAPAVWAPRQSGKQTAVAAALAVAFAAVGTAGVGQLGTTP